MNKNKITYISLDNLDSNTSYAEFLLDDKFDDT